MNVDAIRILARGLVAALFLAGVPAVSAEMLYVANNGVGGNCGAKTTPCRSITQAIHNAAPGDHIIVGPGRYNGETGALNCDCFLAINKRLILTSSDGAASTVIDARGFETDTNVLLRNADGSEFGRPGAGFTVTNPKAVGGTGIAIDSINVKVRGNQVVADGTVPSPGTGIVAVTANPGPILIEANQVMLWTTGIDAEGEGKTLNKNQLSLNVTGAVLSSTGRATGNVIVASIANGLDVTEGVTATGNGLYGNGQGLFAVGPFTGAIARNNFVGTAGFGDHCGVANNGIPDLIATDNYWGAATGPGPVPADTACAPFAGTAITTSPFAKAPFPVRAPIRP